MRLFGLEFPGLSSQRSGQCPTLPKCLSFSPPVQRQPWHVQTSGAGWEGVDVRHDWWWSFTFWGCA